VHASTTRMLTLLRVVDLAPIAGSRASPGQRRDSQRKIASGHAVELGYHSQAPSGHVEQLLGSVGDLTPRRGSPHRPRNG
jgi:hypothetical protein